ncbi:MAG: bestrophin family ion channel, partial [Myxococcota bacterium]
MKLLLTMRGSVLPRIAGRLACVFVFACLVEAFDLFRGSVLDLTLIPFTLIGLALSIFLGFRNNTSYDRLW